ncbi:unnamed protein product [Agarophyton chilense]
MGAVTSRRALGGRWSAVYSMWTYIHRLLHLLGIATVDKEEVALLSAPLVRIRCVRRHRTPVVLAHNPCPMFPDEPVGWVPPSQVHVSSTLFFLHFDISDSQRGDRARIATAAPSDTTPRAWLAVDHKTGTITLAASETAAAVFQVCLSNAKATIPQVHLQCTCTAGRYLSVHLATMRARVNASSVTACETFLINHVPMPPTLTQNRNELPPQDCTMAAAFQATRSCPLRIQSKAFGWFLASKPGAPVASSRGKDSGWDGFVLEYDSPTRSAHFRDSRRLYIGFTEQLDQLVAAQDPSTEDDENKLRELHSLHRAERFDVEIVADGDLVTLRSRKGYVSARRDGRIVLSQNTQPGRREQFYLRLSLPSMMDQSTPRLRLRACDGGARQIEASILVPTPAQIAFDVLRDYDGFHEFIHDASESRVLERKSDTELTVLMVQCHTFLILTIPMTMVLNVVESPERKTVVMDLKSGLGVKAYKGVWQAVERPDGRCLLRCTLLAATAVPAPGFLIDGLMSHAMSETMTQLRVECIRRSTKEYQTSYGNSVQRHAAEQRRGRNSKAALKT